VIITSAKYTTVDGTNNDGIDIIVDGIKISVPINEKNRHYQAIQEWVADGNTIEEAD
jgi:hypothetical protein